MDSRGNTSLADIGASVLFYPHFSTAINNDFNNFFLPLIIALVPRCFNETLGWRRLSAIIFGFVGMGLIVRRWRSLGFTRTMALVQFCVALRDLITRRLSNDDRPLALFMHFALFHDCSCLDD